MNASFVLGQTGFTSNTVACTQSGLHQPEAVAVDSGNGRLYVADNANSRVLEFDTSSLANGMNASIVLGQSDFTTLIAGSPTQGFFGSPQGLAFDATNQWLYVVSSRVTVFDTTTLTNGMDALTVLGQASFTGSATGTSSSLFQTPAGVAVDPSTSHLFVSDQGNNRVLLSPSPEGDAPPPPTWRRG